MGIEVERNTSKFIVLVSNFLESQNRKVFICSCSSFHLSCQFPKKYFHNLVFNQAIYGINKTSEFHFWSYFNRLNFFSFLYHTSRLNKLCLFQIKQVFRYGKEFLPDGVKWFIHGSLVTPYFDWTLLYFKLCFFLPYCCS